jgi:hypothetical protein
MPNPYAKSYTPGHMGHSSKPSVFYGIEGEKMRLNGPVTRRQRALYQGHQPLVKLGDKSRKSRGGRRGRKSRRHTRRH